MKKYLRFLGVALFASALALTGCNFNPGNNNGENGENGENGGNGYSGEVGWENGVMRIHFNLSDAKALASQEKGSEAKYIGSARANDETEGLLVKILDDGSLASVIEFPEGTNADEFVITQIAVSPAKDADELYVVVNNGSGNFGIGGLLCVKSDGTYYDILTDLRNSLENSSSFDLYGNSSDNDYIKFDKLGNMYFQTRTWQNNRDTTMIYKYNPKRNEATVLTPAVSGTYYEDYIVSDNGSWIFASASRWMNGKSTRYLRAIPTANAEQYVNITYSSDGNGWYKNLIYDDENGYLYFNGWVKSSSGIYRIQKKDGTFDSKDLKCMTSNGGSSSFWFSNMVNYTYVNMNLNTLIDSTNQSECVYDIRFNKLINYRDEAGSWFDYTIKDLQGNLRADELIRVFVNELNYSTDDTYKYTTSDITEEMLQSEPNLKQVKFSFETFKDINGFEKLAAKEADGVTYKSNQDALLALDDPECLLLLYKLKDSGLYSHNYEVNAYNRNFLQDITYVKDDNGNYIQISPVYFDRKTDIYGTPYYRNNGYISFVYKESENWTTNYNYFWSPTYKEKDAKGDDVTNYKAILNKIFEYCDEGDKYFSLEAFDGDPEYGRLCTKEKDEAALEYIENEGLISLLGNWFWYGSDRQAEFIKKTCFFKDTDESACSISGGANYKWNSDYLNEDGTVNTEAILDKFFSACEAGEKEFNLKYFGEKPEWKDDLYTDAIDEEAILFLSTSDRLRRLWDYVYQTNGDEGNKNLIKNTCFKKGTTETAYDESSSNGSYISWEYSNLKAMAKTSKGIFGSVPGYQWNNGTSTYYNTFMKFFDEKGTFQMYTIPNSLKYYATEIQVTGDLMVFKNSVMNENGDETGSHTLQAFDASTSSFIDLFEKVDGSNIEILSYSVGGGYVYFCGVQGLSLISGKIDMSTKAYIPINSSKKMCQIITVTQ